MDTTLTPADGGPDEHEHSARENESPDLLAHALFAAIEARDRDAVARLVHPTAELEMAMARGQTVRGREAVLATLEAAWARVHSLRIDEAEVLSPMTVLLCGRSRHPIEPGGFADTGVFWLCTYRDGLLWRQRVFENVDDARAAWDETKDEFEALPRR
jgi:ketosteroid isomerase-like protein